MDMEDGRKDLSSSVSSNSVENKDEDGKTCNVKEDLEVSTSNVIAESKESESRRSSVSLDDEEEGKRTKKRKDKEDNTRKEEHCNRNKEDYSRKEEYNSKKEEYNTANRVGKNLIGNGASPKSSVNMETSENEESFKNSGSPGPKVPPLKIVIPPAETEQGNKNGKNATRHHGGLPYVVVSNDETSIGSTTVTTSPSSPTNQNIVIKEEVHSPSSNVNSLNDEQRIQQRVLRSTHSNRLAMNNSNNNGASGGSVSSSSSNGGNSSAASGNSSPVVSEVTSPQDVGSTSKEENNPKTKTDLSVKGKLDVNGAKKTSEASNKMKNEPEDDTKSVSLEVTRGVNDMHNKETTTVVELHPRKRKLKTKQETNHNESDHSVPFGSLPHPHEVPVTNCYQMFMDIRRQIDVKRKGLFPIQPKPPQGFKDYLMNRCTYTLAGNSIPRLKRRTAEPPEGIPDGIKNLYQEQESERYSLRMQHVVEKEKLVLSVEQEILRVHGRAARALANQALPFSACTILKDEEVYNVITPEQEEKDRNARSRYNGRLFISWLQDVDDKWEKIKEEMLARHHKEAESLNAIQKFNWDLKMRQLGLWKKRKFMPVDENYVPMISVSDDFDLLPE